MLRIGAKLLLTYVVLIAMVATAMGLGLPRLVESKVAEVERSRLDSLAQKQAEAVTRKLRTAVLNQGDVTMAGKQALQAVEDWLAGDDTMALVDGQCIIFRASDPKLVGKRVENCDPAAGATLAQKRRAANRPVLTVEGNADLILAMAPLPTTIPVLKNVQLLLIRDVAYVRQLSDPIVRRLRNVLILALIAALGIAGWMSREIMAERVQTLADGLRRSEQGRKELLVVVSHELRTPMTSIAGFAEALRDGVVQDEERKRRYYEIIAAEAARLNRLINDLFDVAKLEAGQMELRMQAMAVVPFLVEFAEGFSPVAAGSGVGLDLVVDPSAEGCRIYGDRDRLDQVLNNLCSNAVRFSPPGGAITLRARAEGDDLVLEVSDQGSGIPPEEASRVFERFFQGTNRGQGHKGAGLGLAIVKSLVEAHGGLVGVQSAPGAGATFWIRLKRTR